MNETGVVLIEIADGVATLTLSRPQALNAITRTMLVELAAALDVVAGDPSVKAVVLTGAGRAFSAGVDLKALAGWSLESGSVGDYLDVPARAVIARITELPKIVIARVNGFCFTGALELAVACDLVISADEAKFADTHAKWGLRPTWGMSQRLARVVGIARARELSYTARVFSGSEAAEWGLAIRSVPLSKLDETVAEVVAAVVANSVGSLVAYKDLYGRALESGLSAGLEYEAETTYVITDTQRRLNAFA